MSIAQSEKAARFRALHHAPGAFVLPNVWDAGSARLVAGFGFPALATSSWATAGVLGRRDYGISREQSLAAARTIVEAVDLPVAADLENGFGDAPETVAETIRAAAAVGLVGGSIEDSTSDEAEPLYPLEVAVGRVAAAVTAARTLPFPFTVTARAEGLLCGRPDLDDVIRRLRAYADAGADVVFAPGLRELTQVRAITAAVPKPLNFMNGIKEGSFAVEELAAAGVKRISLAASLYRTAMTGLRDAVAEIRDRGTFGFVNHAIGSAELSRYWRSE
jgi:2-methylisocitrate lyase-like PEP mutase family enzyme